MGQYSEEALREAQQSIASTLRKSQKVLPKLRAGTAQHRTMARAIAAYPVALALIAEELAPGGKAGLPLPDAGTAKEKLANAIAALQETRQRVEKVLPKLAQGTPQHTLAVRRVAAFRLAVCLIEKAMATPQDKVED